MTTLEQELKSLPAKPGVYVFHNARGSVLYVGKAKVLKNRVRSYFQPGAVLEPAKQPHFAKPTRGRQMAPNPTLNPAKQQMVLQIDHIDTISCDTEHEALILEANLIREHKPPYNVVLTDDKYYLFIKISKDPLPRVYPVRKISPDHARYFGPYSSATSVRQTLKLLRRLFPHFGESYNEKTWLFPHPLFTQPLPQGLGAPHNSAQPSDVGLPSINQEHYRDNIKNVISFLEGKRGHIMDRLRAGMQQASREKAFERAALFRNQLHAIEKMEGSQKVYLATKESFDVISIVTRGTQSAANVFSVREGKLLQKNTFLLKHRVAAATTDVLRQFLLQYYGVAQDIPPVILVPHALPDQMAITTWINKVTPPELLVPVRGKKRQLLNMGELNAQQLLTLEEVDFESSQRLARACEQLAAAVGVTQPLHRIETYDISNIQGTLATGSMIVFIDGKPSKQHYKKFRIHLGETPNDFAMLQEVLERRFSNRHRDLPGRQAGWPMPDLIMIDGGKGQLSAARTALAQANISIPVISLAKREEEIFIPDTSAAVRLPFDSDALYLIQRMRDEAHRFTITYHRLLRSKRASRSLLDEVPGIGPTFKRRLLATFGSLKGIKGASTAELEKIIGPAKTKVLREYL